MAQCHRLISVTSSKPIDSGALLTGLSPFNVGDCSGEGVNATSTTGEPYTGLSMSIKNSGSVPLTISIYVDSVASLGQHVQRKYTFSNVPADNTAHVYSVTWEAAHQDDCALPSASSFDQTKITGLGFGVEATTTTVQLDLTLADVTFTNAPIPTTPCSGLCSNPVTFAAGLGLNNVTTPICRETTSAIQGGNCGNFTTGAVYVNGTQMNCNWGNWAAIPDKVADGYCLFTTDNPSTNAGLNIW